MATIATIGHDAIAAPKYRVVKEGREGAFTIEIPHGWVAQGGYARRGPQLVLDWTAYSPDREITIGLHGGSHFQDPRSPLAAIQAWDGLVPYLPAKAYLESRIVSPIRDAGIFVTRNVPTGLPDLAPQTHDMGEVYFGYMVGKTHYMAYAFAWTLDYGLTGLWQVAALWRVDAPAGRFTEALGTLKHALTTWEYDQSWTSANSPSQSNSAQYDLGKAIAVARATITRSNDLWNRSRDEQARNWLNTLGGKEDYFDTTRGTEYQVNAGWRHYWVDDLGNVVGTEKDEVPWGFRRLERIR